MTCIYSSHSLQLDFAVSVTALLGVPFPFGRCSVSILSISTFIYVHLIFHILYDEFTMDCPAQLYVSSLHSK